MGDCYSKDGKKKVDRHKEHKPKKKDRRGSMETSRELQEVSRTFLAIEKGNTLRFTHTPLSACEFLQNKFRNNPSRPEEVALTFMLLELNVCTEKNEIRMRVVNENEVNAYVVVGGEEKVNNTGLTIEISKGRYAEAVRKKPSRKEGDELLVVPTKLHEKPIYVVLEPCLKTQSLFLLYRYMCEGGAYRRVSVTLMVPVRKLSGAAWRLTSTTSTDRMTSLRQGVGRSVPCACQAQPTPSSTPAGTCACARAAVACLPKNPASVLSAAQNISPRSSTATNPTTDPFYYFHHRLSHT